MSDQDPFNNEPKPGETPPASNDNPFADKLSAIVNESGEPKYKDVETALEALQASQEHIRKIEQENKALATSNTEKDAELAKRASIEDFVNKITPNTQQPASAPETPKPEDMLSEDKVKEMLMNTLSAEKKKAAEDANLSTVIKTLSEKHGDKANAFVAQRAKELDTTPAALQEMAKSNPKVVLNLLGGEVKSNDAPAPSFNQKTSNTTPNGNEPPKIEKGVARGGMTNAQVMEKWKEVANFTNKELGVES